MRIEFSGSGSGSESVREEIKRSRDQEIKRSRDQEIKNKELLVKDWIRGIVAISTKRGMG